MHTKKGRTVFPRIDLLPEKIVKYLKRDSSYQSEHAQDYDLSWQAIQLGYVGDAGVYQHFETVSVYDNYRFVRRYFHGAWVLYVLFIRLLSFKNPVKELRAWFNTRQVRRFQEFSPIKYSEWLTFDSILMDRNPKVSIIIPTLNRYDHLEHILRDFEKQDYTNFEVLVIDQSDNYDPDFYTNFNLNIQLIRQEEKALWLARNTGIKRSKGDIIGLSEDDVRIKTDWISAHLKCLDFFKVQVSAGVFYPDGQKIPRERSFFAIGSQFATGNAMLYRDVFKRVGLFDRQFEKQRMGDGEFGMRLYLADLKSVSNPEASCVDIKAGTGGLRELGSWDAFRPTSLFAPRPIPSVLYYFRRYYGNVAARWSLLRTIPMSILPYQFKKSRLMLLFALLLSIMMLPLVLFQVGKSWMLASEKLKEGPLIDELER
ncbi:glycosyltransferase family 2 protein [Hanstruepera ponticola]|uniref:glycosyltransferase family 2 protein n=1 Tax=Hanstruepera ponticola TaxID=2042995 RepID=UPI001F2E937A|nr:glycosyltransferase family A protein [Hanstruepera ponticola]